MVSDEKFGQSALHAIQSFLVDEAGSAWTEYLLLACLIAVTCKLFFLAFQDEG